MTRTVASHRCIVAEVADAFCHRQVCLGCSRITESTLHDPERPICNECLEGQRLERLGPPRLPPKCPSCGTPIASCNVYYYPSEAAERDGDAVSVAPCGVCLAAGRAAEARRAVTEGSDREGPLPEAGSVRDGKAGRALAFPPSGSRGVKRGPFEFIVNHRWEKSLNREQPSYWREGDTFTGPDDLRPRNTPPI